MRIGIRLGLTLFVLALSLAVAALVHGMWSAAAERNSRSLASVTHRQIVAAVERELSTVAAEARSAFGSIRTLFFQNVLETREADKREFVFLSQLQAHGSISWIVFGWPNGDFFASHKLGDARLEMIEVNEENGQRRRRVDRYLVFPADIEFQERSFVSTTYRPTDENWYREGVGIDWPRWIRDGHPPGETRPALVFVGRIEANVETQGVLGIVIEHARLSRFLANLMVGRTGSAFIVDTEGRTIAGPDPRADEVTMAEVMRHPHHDIAVASLRASGLRYEDQVGDTRELRRFHDGEAFATTVSPLGFPGWALVTVVPEQEFLGQIDEANRRLAWLLAFAVGVALIVSVAFGERLIAAPLARVAAELKHVERFELDRVARRRSHVAEIDRLSSTISAMAAGLLAFRKYLPADLVRVLVREGVEAKPGGSLRAITVLFSDVAGFTRLTERMGEGIVPILGRYFEIANQEIHARRGTVDKFIGDAVMAFWGAPAADPAHALRACEAALALRSAIATSGVVDDRGSPLALRIGINTGEAIVGNIGSDERLNYTAIGDVVNVASRLEGLNKVYGTSLLIGEATRREAGEAVVAREIDYVAVYGRAQPMAVYELIGIAAPGEPPPGWIALYARGLAAYRDRRFADALAAFDMLLEIRPTDGPARVMATRCGALIAAPPGPDWEPITAPEAK